MRPQKAEPLLPGRAEGRVLALAAPISFWGGVSPVTGSIIDARHPDRGSDLAGAIVCLPGTIGSSSASSVLLELIRNRRAPAALVLDHVDPVLLIGALVAREMGWPPPPAFLLPAAAQRLLAGRRIAIAEDGTIDDI
jgi:predicted aconitase with swiveling domain